MWLEVDNATSRSARPVKALEAMRPLCPVPDSVSARPMLWIAPIVDWLKCRWICQRTPTKCKCLPAYRAPKISSFSFPFVLALSFSWAGPSGFFKLYYLWPVCFNCFVFFLTSLESELSSSPPLSFADSLQTCSRDVVDDKARLGIKTNPDMILQWLLLLCHEMCLKTFIDVYHDFSRETGR